MALVMVNGEPVLLANVGGEFHAVSALCTHQGTPLSYGWLEGEVVTCGWHGACFSVTTGQVLAGPAFEDLERYTVKVDGQQVLIRRDLD